MLRQKQLLCNFPNKNKAWRRVEKYSVFQNKKLPQVNRKIFNFTNSINSKRGSIHDIINRRGNTQKTITNALSLRVHKSLVSTKQKLLLNFIGISYSDCSWRQFIIYYVIQSQWKNNIRTDRTGLTLQSDVKVHSK